MAEQVPIGDSARADQFESEGVREILPGLAYPHLAIVDWGDHGTPRSDAWVPMDAAVHQAAEAIRPAAATRYRGTLPAAAIVEILGHFGQVGASRPLAESSQVPIHAPPQSHPFLNDRTSYPPPDATADGGITPALSHFHTRGSVHVRCELGPPPADRPKPIHTPTDRPSCDCPWSERDLIAGNAFVTTRRQRVHAVATRKPEVRGPPMYLR